jgi:anaerobic magnesium-protoporphyrin IX monomethyl ester cyclase
MKIALVALYDLFSHGIRGLHSFLDEKGYDVSSYYFYNSTYTDTMYAENEMAVLADNILKLKPDYVGISVRSPLFPVFKDLAKRLRPHVKIITGGPHSTACPEDCLRYADYAVVGDGEHAILDILNGYSEGVVKGERFLEIDELPFSHYGDNTFVFCRSKSVTVHNKQSIYSTRGCHFACCSYCQESIMGNKPIRKSVARLKRETDYLLKKFPQTEIYTFADPIFMYDMDWLEEFASVYSGSGLKFLCNACASFITEDMVKAVKKAGMYMVRIGVQSGCQTLRREIYNRKDSLDDVIRVSKLLEEHEILGHYDFIIESPYDTPETIAKTRRFIMQLPRSAWINKFEMRYWPNTPFTNRAIEDGYITPGEVEGNFFRFGDWTYTYHNMLYSGAK